jgi:SAM-dependent methyltransferase
VTATTQSTVPSSARVARARAYLDLATGRGLEIGPLASPIVRKDEANVAYVDVLDADTLRTHYAQDPGVIEGNVVDLDFVLHQAGVTRSLADVVGPAGAFQWVIASHVVEHVPDLIAFLADVAAILDDYGRLALVVPDRRYCFDALRPPTTVGEMLLAHDNRDSRPSVRAVFDHFASAVGFDPVQLWRGVPADPANRMYPLEQAWELVERRRNTGDYLDSHTWLFTPESFVEQVGVLARLGLNDFTVAGMSPTAVNDYEFFVTLERIPRGASADDRAAAIDAGFAVGSASSPPVADVEVPPAQHDAVTMLVSARERRLLELKRCALAPVHRAVRAVRDRRR